MWWFDFCLYLDVVVLFRLNFRQKENAIEIPAILIFFCFVQIEFPSETERYRNPCQAAIDTLKTTIQQQCMLRVHFNLESMILSFYGKLFLYFYLRGFILYKCARSILVYINTT